MHQIGAVNQPAKHKYESYAAEPRPRIGRFNSSCPIRDQLCNPAMIIKSGSF